MSPSGSSLLNITSAEAVPRPPLEPVFIHSPKCGSSFEASVRLHGGRNHGVHQPIGDNATAVEVGRFAMLFRQPEERMMSMYWWMRQKGTGCCKPAHFGWPSDAEWSRVTDAIKKGKAPQTMLQPYQGCQLHMLSGHRCCSRHVYQRNLSFDAIVSAATARIDQLFFVGLTSEWRLTVCLFNFKMTGVRYVTALQLRDCRPGDAPADLASYQKSHNHSLEEGVWFRLANRSDYSMVPRDKYDHAVYDHASDRFARELAAHKISHATCPSASELIRSSSCTSGTKSFLDPRDVWQTSFARLFPRVAKRFVDWTGS